MDDLISGDYITYLQSFFFSRYLSIFSPCFIFASFITILFLL